MDYSVEDKVRYGGKIYIINKIKSESVYSIKNSDEFVDLVNDSMLMRVFSDDERPHIAQCYDCGLRYASNAWCDTVIPDEYWEQINPTFHSGGGLLCFNCITNRCVKAGLENVPLKITSGPFLTGVPLRTADGVEVTPGMTIYVLNDVLGWPFTEHTVLRWDDGKIYFAEPDEDSKIGVKAFAKIRRVFAAQNRAEEGRKIEAKADSIGRD